MTRPRDAAAGTLEPIEIESAGLMGRFLFWGTGTRCGDIKDGVSFEVRRPGSDFDGVFVVDRAALLDALGAAATPARGKGRRKG